MTLRSNKLKKLVSSVVLEEIKSYQDKQGGVYKAKHADRILSKAAAGSQRRLSDLVGLLNLDSAAEAQFKAMFQAALLSMAESGKRMDHKEKYAKTKKHLKDVIDAYPTANEGRFVTSYMEAMDFGFGVGKELAFGARVS